MEFSGIMAGRTRFVEFGWQKAQRGCSEEVSPGLHGMFQLLLSHSWLWSFSETTSMKD